MNRIERMQAIDALQEEVLRFLWDKKDRSAFGTLMDYLRDESASVPVVKFTADHLLDHYLESITRLFEKPDQWDAFDHHLLKLLTHKDYWMPFTGIRWRKNGHDIFFNDWLRGQVRNEYTPHTVPLVIQALQQHGIPESQVLQAVITTMPDLLMTSDKALTSAGQLVLEYAAQHSQLLREYVGQAGHYFTDLLFQHQPNLVDEYLDGILSLTKDDTGETTISVPSVRLLLEHDFARYESAIVQVLPQVTHPQVRNEIHQLLIKHGPDKYQPKALSFAYDYLEGLRKKMRAQEFVDFYNWREGRYVTALEEQINLLLSQEGIKAKTYVHELLRDCQKLDAGVLTTVIRHLGQEGVDILMEGLRMNHPAFNPTLSDALSFFRTFFSLVSGLNYQAYDAQIWAFTQHKTKSMREMAAVTLSKQGEKAIPKATALLQAKSADQRQIGALILSLIPGELAQKTLLAALNQEKNDDVRDLMLEGLADRLAQPHTEAALAEQVQAAALRGKLEAPLESWLSEEKLPPLYWKNSSQPLSIPTVRYLLYRQSRAKDIRPDREAKPLIELMDRSRSHDFAQALLISYFNNGADSKQKYCLTLAGLLGGNQTIDLLQSKVEQWAEAGRGKMAEYAVKAIALSATNKALRAVEFFSRKYKSKNKNIGEAAQQAFIIAAEEMGISAYELADSIVPDFGFVGLFRDFEVNQEPFRAFINNDFKLAYLNDDGKVLKSLPKNTDKALVEEFKEISKEIRDIVKSQSSRLEQYLVTQRKWDSASWQTFFMGNPVMFAYAVRLIWGAFDSQGQLQFTFRCLEDQSLVNQAEEECQLAPELSIGMVHPLLISEGEIQFWQQHLEDSDVKPIFPQLNRPIVLLPPQDQEKRMSHEFRNQKVGGYHLVSQMEKRGWHRGSVIDGGSISSYYKSFPDVALSVFLNIEGIGMGYYEGEAQLQALYAVQSGSIKLGSYTYDEPENEQDARLIPFKDIPAVIYSEVMSDLRALIPQVQETA